MKRFSKAILIALAVMAALVVAAMVGANLYLQSPGVQARIQEELSRALRMPLTITNTSFTPWSDLRITGITIPNGDANLLEAASFSARYRLLPLLEKKLIIHRVTVDGPKIVWGQGTDGKWTLPRAEEAAAVSAANPPEEPKTEEPKSEGPKTRKKSTSNLQVTVESGRIQRGTIELLDRERQHVVTLTDVTLDFTKLSAERIEGTATIGRAAWAKALVLEEFKTPFIYADGTLELPALDAHLGGGFLNGRITWKPGDGPGPFTSALTFEHVELARVGTDAGWTDGSAAGSLAGTVTLAGTAREWQRAEGNAKLTLRNGRFQNLFYFELIGHALQIKELSDLRLNDSQATLRFADEKAFIEALTLDAADLQLSGTGYARIDGKLQIAARLTAREPLFQELPEFVRGNFVAGADHARFIDFSITGKTGKPKTDLLDKIVGQKIETKFDELLSSLFNTKKKAEPKKDDKKKKKKDGEKEGDATPAPDGAVEAQ